MFPKILETVSKSALSAIKPTRRGFLLGAAAGAAGLAVGFRWQAPAVAQDAPAVHPFQPYVAIAPDGHVTIYSSQFEMGQGAYFGIATLVNEELDAEWPKITSKAAPAMSRPMAIWPGVVPRRERAARPP